VAPLPQPLQRVGDTAAFEALSTRFTASFIALKQM
jgi:hypothetical protein